MAEDYSPFEDDVEMDMDLSSDVVFPSLPSNGGNALLVRYLYLFFIFFFD
jgi:hypothetical protein